MRKLHGFLLSGINLGKKWINLGIGQFEEQGQNEVNLVNQQCNIINMDLASWWCGFSNPFGKMDLINRNHQLVNLI